MGWWREKFDFWIALICEKNEDGKYKRASLGRVSFWITFGLAIYVWVATDGDVQPAHLQMLYITATYNLMKKATFFGKVESEGGKSKITIDHQAEENEPAPRI